MGLQQECRANCRTWECRAATWLLACVPHRPSEFSREPLIRTRNATDWRYRLFLRPGMRLVTTVRWGAALRRERRREWRERSWPFRIRAVRSRRFADSRAQSSGSRRTKAEAGNHEVSAVQTNGTDEVWSWRDQQCHGRSPGECGPHPAARTGIAPRSEPPADIPTCDGGLAVGASLWSDGEWVWKRVLRTYCGRSHGRRDRLNLSGLATEPRCSGWVPSYRNPRPRLAASWSSEVKRRWRIKLTTCG